ncbi:MAG: TIR domain-containing protein, partial [Acidobacteriota bacterium]
MKRAKGKDDGAALALYDVFLSHSNSDKPVVEGLARRLHERDIRPFLDKWHLVPGEPWQEALESALDQSSSCAVFLGSTLGPWQNEEMRAALNERARNPQFRVIPVLLPGATFSSIRDLPRFLDNLTWVDLRDGIDERGVDVLVSGIRGVAPDPDGSLSSTGVHSNVDVELRDRYLDWLIREHGTLELPGLAQLGRRPTVELETVYVALRGDLAGSHERLQSRELLEEQARNLENLSDLQQLEPDKKLRLLARLVARAPVPLSLEERDRPQLLPSTTDRREQIITLGEAFRRERRLVILGDPGSGKTTLVRWLAMQLARSCREGRATVEVPVHHVDPDASIGEETLVLGPTRVPILVRIASFAEARKLDPQLSLAAFLGHHLAPPGKQAHTVDGRTLEPQPLHEFFLGELAAGRAVLLLDGLDEINDPLDRWEIVQEIDRFLDAWLPAADELQVAESWGRKRLVGQPFRDGGLQVVITSRIVGYQMAPLSHDATHLTIEPMESRAVDRFCDVWVRANHRAAMAPSDWDQDCEDKARDEAEGLKAAIAGLHERGAADLASNPLLITILALVYQGRKGFPRQRVRLYETAVDILLDKWRLRTQSRGERALSNEQVLDVLIPLAADIHTTSAIGVIDEDQLDQALHHYLEPEAVLALRTVIRSEVGLLTARGEGVYGFLHLTFQEYLAARFLIRETSRSTQLLLDKLSAPRWREPILMAIGQLASELDEPALDELLLQMLDRPDPLGQLVPRALFLIVAALPEMRTVPNRSMEALCRRLIELASRRGTLERFPVLRQQVEGAYRQLLRYESDLSGSERIAERALCDALREPDSPSLRWAAAELVRSCRAESIELAEALSVSLEHDTEEWEWPIDRALRELKARRKDLVIGDHRSLGRALARDRELEERFLADSGWLRVGMVLYGGLDSALPQRLSRLRSQLLHLDEEVNAWQARTVTPEQQARLVELGEAKTARQEELDELQSRGYRFHIDSIHRDVPWLTPDILAALRADRSPASLVDKLRERCRDRRCPLDIYTEALLVLVALDEPIDEELHRRPRSAERLAAALSRIYRQLEPAVPSTVVPTFEMLGPAVEHCGDSDWIDLVSAVLDLVLYCGHKPQSPLVLDTAAGAAVRPHIWAEFWQQMAAWHSDDPYYNLAVVLDTNGFLAKDPMLLARSFADANVAANARWSQHRGWSLDALAPIPTTDSEVYAAALDALVTLPEPFDVLRGWVIQALAPELERLGLLPEARVIAFGSLSNRLRIREATLRRLDEIAVSDRKEASTSDATTVLDLVTTVENLADPYLRFRGYWQL